MRVSDNMTFGTIKESMQRVKNRMQKHQIETSTLKKLTTPSDDPIGSIKILEIRTEGVNTNQFLANTQIAEGFLNTTDHALANLTEILIRAKEIALSQASDTSTPDSRLGIAEEVLQLYQQAVSIANTKIGDRYILGGYQTDKAPVDGKGNYQGDNGKMMTEISKGAFIAMNLPGMEVFNTEPESSRDWERVYGPKEGEKRDEQRELATKPKKINRNIFDELQNLRVSLLAGDVNGVRNSLENFDELRAHVVAMRARVGSRVMGIKNMVQTLQRQEVTNAELSSSIEDADMVEAVNGLAKEETVLRSALNSANKLIQPTLLDFLR